MCKSAWIYVQYCKYTRLPCALHNVICEMLSPTDMKTNDPVPHVQKFPLFFIISDSVISDAGRSTISMMSKYYSAWKTPYMQKIKSTSKAKTMYFTLLQTVPLYELLLHIGLYVWITFT